MAVDERLTSVWYAVVDDVGGWGVATRDLPPSMTHSLYARCLAIVGNGGGLDPGDVLEMVMSEVYQARISTPWVADAATEELATHVVALHNEALSLNAHFQAVADALAARRERLDEQEGEP